MTNEVDVLMVGGAASGRMFCVNRERMTKTLAFPVPGGEQVYTLKNWQHPVNNKWYHIATRGDAEPTDAEIIVAIVMDNFTPAWDLN